MRRVFWIKLSVFLLLALVPASMLSAGAEPETGTGSRKKVTINQHGCIEVRGDFQVGPTRFVLDMDPGEERTIQVKLLSRQGEQRNFEIGVEDFSVSDDGTDSVQFYGNGNGPFSARSWIQPEISTINLDHGEEATISVKITVPKNAAVGEHYSVVLFQRTPKENARAGFNMISRVGALILLTVRGDTVTEGTLQQFSTSKRVYFALPAQFLIQYRNTGTVHIVPRGKIEIKNMFGITVDEIPLRDWYVLRSSTRRREIVWLPRFALGYYTAQLSISGVGGEPDIRIGAPFWVIPALPVLLAIIAIFGASFLVQIFFSRFEIKKKKER